MSRPWGRLAAGAALLFIATLQVHRLDDSDVWWHLASGRLIAQTADVARTDPFSFTAAGAPWLNRQWLFEVGAYGAWQAAGPAGPALAAGALHLAAFACLLLLARRRLPLWAAAVLVYLAASAAVERFTMRPEAVTFLGIGLYLLLLDGRMTARRALALVMIHVVWANAHALSILGLAVLAAEAVSALIASRAPQSARWLQPSRREPSERRHLGLATLGVMAAECITPFGVAGALYPLWLFGLLRGGSLMSTTVIEHKDTVLAELSPEAALALVALLAIAAVAAVVGMGRWRLSHLLVAAGFAYLALVARRNVALVGFGTIPLIAVGMSPLVTRISSSQRSRSLLGALCALAFVIQTGRVVHGDYYQRARLTRTFGLGQSLLLAPSGVSFFLDDEIGSGRVLNDDMLGGLLLWEGRGTRRVFIDGRMQVYPPAVYEDWQVTLSDPSRFPDLAERWGIQAVALHHPSPGRLEMAGAIARRPDWHVAYLDAGGVVLTRSRPEGLPAGLEGPALAASTPGISGWLESVLRPLRSPTESATAAYQRGRAVHFLLGPAGYPLARSDFTEALRLVPGYEPARIGLRAITSSR